MSGLVYALDKFPDQRSRLEVDPGLIGNTISEVIRWQTPLAHMRRHAVQDADVMGTIIPAEDRIILWYISGNRDESVFENADALVIDRTNARRHLSFGYGVHRCVGARLAELQVGVLAEEMAKRRMRVHVQGEPERVPQSFVNGYVAMPVEVARY